MKIGDRIKVKSVDKSKKSLEAFVFLYYNIDDAKSIFDYDRVIGYTGTTNSISPDLNNVFVTLDDWYGDVVFKASELEVIA